MSVQGLMPPKNRACLDLDQAQQAKTENRAEKIAVSQYAVEVIINRDTVPIVRRWLVGTTTAENTTGFRPNTGAAQGRIKNDSG